MTNKLNTFSKLLRKKKDLMICIFLTLAFQLVITIITIEWNKDKQLLGKQTILKALLQFIFLIFLIFLMVSTTLPFFIKQLLFIIFSVFFGFVLSQSLQSHRSNHHRNSSYIYISQFCSYVYFWINHCLYGL